MFFIYQVEIVTILGYWQLFATIVVGILLILAIIKDRNKRNEISRTLLFAFIAFFLGMLTQVTGTFMRIFDYDHGSWVIGEQNWIIKWQIFLIGDYQYSYFFITMGAFCLFLFSRTIFVDKKGNIGKVLALLFMGIIIGFGLIKPLIPVDFSSSDVGQILWGIDVWVLLYVFTITIPLIISGTKLYKRIPKNMPTRSNVKYITLFSIFFLLLLLCFILETVWGIIFGSYENIWSFIAWSMMIVSLYSSYQGFYSKPQKMKIITEKKETIA